jgi:hypothetical protein
MLSQKQRKQEEEEGNEGEEARNVTKGHRACKIETIGSD